MGDLDEDEDLKALVRARKRRQWTLRLVIVGFFVAFFGMIAWNVSAPWRRHRARLLTSDEEQRLLVELDATEKRLLEQEHQWEEAASPERVAALAPGDAPCPLALVAPTSSAADSYVQYGSIDGNFFGNTSYSEVERGASLGKCGSCAWRREEVDKVRARLQEHELERGELRWAERHRGGVIGNDVFLFVAERVDPQPMGTSFSPGRVVGRAVIYSFDQGRFVCAADIDARNAASVMSRSSYLEGNFPDQQPKAGQSMRAALDRDLRVQVMKAIAEHAQGLE